MALWAKTYGSTANEFWQLLGRPRPLAVDFYDAIATQHGFTAVALGGR